VVTGQNKPQVPEGRQNTASRATSSCLNPWKAGTSNSGGNRKQYAIANPKQAAGLSLSNPFGALYYAKSCKSVKW